jgi:cyclin B
VLLFNVNRSFDADDVHLTGIVSMFIASKYVDVYPLKMNIVQDKIAHAAFSHESIKCKERDVMKTIQFHMTFPTVLTILENLIETLAFSQRKTFKEDHWVTLEKIKNACIYYGKMIQYNYTMQQYS